MELLRYLDSVWLSRCERNIRLWYTVNYGGETTLQFSFTRNSMLFSVVGMELLRHLRLRGLSLWPVSMISTFAFMYWRQFLHVVV